MITSPFIPKYLSAPRCATLHGLIYLIGDNTKKVHVYDPEANIWQKVVACSRSTASAWSYGFKQRWPSLSQCHQHETPAHSPGHSIPTVHCMSPKQGCC